MSLKLNNVSIELDNEPSNDSTVKKLPLDEKMSLEYYKTDQLKEAMIGSNTETKSLETQWAEFHRFKNKIIFAIQLFAVVSVQGMKAHRYFISFYKTFVRFLLRTNLWANQ